MGPHQCAGAPLGRLMMRVTLESLLGLTRRIELDGGEDAVVMTRWPEWGTLSVPLRVTPA